jgi:hypothetical protein
LNKDAKNRFYCKGIKDIDIKQETSCCSEIIKKIPCLVVVTTVEIGVVARTKIENIMV